MEQNKLNMDATQNILEGGQVYAFTSDLSNIFHSELVEEYPNINKYELREFELKILQPRIKAILCTLNNGTYEDIVKVVHDKLNLNDLFDNRSKYLN
jgi:hypothetical protein